jgi:uncharacterized phage protein gp47/JayE
MANGLPVASIDQNGISIPLYSEVLAYFQDQYRLIYGADVNLAEDTQDGQWVAIFAAAINDTNQTIAAAYQAYSPTFAQGAGLSSVIKINGIRRLVPSSSSVTLRCVGQPGAIIGNALVGDNLNLRTQWLLPANTVIPAEGEIIVTAVCTVSGAVSAGSNTITEIITPVPGWQTVNNENVAVPGAPVEGDAPLRRRQTQSVANPSQTVVVGIQGAIENLPGVQRVMVYENDTNATDENGIPPFSMAAIVQGGNSQDIANAISLRKTPGSPTFGTTSFMVFDTRGVPSRINFFELTMVPITVAIDLKVLPGFTAIVEQEIIASVVAYLVGLPIGYDSYYSKLVAATQLPDPDGLTYDIVEVLQARDGNTPIRTDVPISYIEAVTATIDNITVTVHP